jgi:hypothetical protein
MANFSVINAMRDPIISVAALESAWLDAGYCIDATDDIPIGGAILRPDPGSRGRYKPGAWYLPAHDQCTWDSGHPAFAHSRA